MVRAPDCVALRHTAHDECATMYDYAQLGTAPEWPSRHRVADWVTRHSRRQSRKTGSSVWQEYVGDDIFMKSARLSRFKTIGYDNVVKLTLDMHPECWFVATYGKEEEAKQLQTQGFERLVCTEHRIQATYDHAVPYVPLVAVTGQEAGHFVQACMIARLVSLGQDLTASIRMCRTVFTPRYNC